MSELRKELRGVLGFGLESQPSSNLHLLAVDAGIYYLSFLQQGCQIGSWSRCHIGKTVKQKL
jgi:hypothetical protein